MPVREAGGENWAALPVGRLSDAACTAVSSGAMVEERLQAAPAQTTLGSAFKYHFSHFVVMIHWSETGACHASHHSASVGLGSSKGMQQPG